MPNIPNTNQPGLFLTSVGDGQNSTQWADSTSPFIQVIDQSPTRYEYIMQIPDTLNASFLEISSNTGNAYVEVDNHETATIAGNIVEIIGGPGNSLNGYVGMEMYASGNLDIYTTAGAGTNTITIGSIVQVSTSGATNNLGFFGNTPVAQQVSGGTLSGVIAGLVALGLFSS